MKTPAEVSREELARIHRAALEGNATKGDLVAVFGYLHLLEARVVILREERDIARQARDAHEAEVRRLAGRADRIEKATDGVLAALGDQWLLDADVNLAEALDILDVARGRVALRRPNLIALRTNGDEP